MIPSLRAVVQQLPKFKFNPHVHLELKYSHPLIACRFDPSGRYLFAASQDNSIQRFDLLSGGVTPLLGHSGWVRAFTFVGPKAKPTPVLPFGYHAVAGGLEVGTEALRTAPPFKLVSVDTYGQMFWWDGNTTDPKPIRRIDAHAGWVRAVATSPDGQTIASVGNDNLVKLWNAADGTAKSTLSGHTSHVYNVAFHPTEKRLVSADLHGIVKDWDLTNGKSVRELDAKILHKYDSGFMADIGGARGMAFDDRGETLACTGITNVSNAFAGVGNPLVILFNWKDGKATQLKTKEAYQGTGWGVYLHNTGIVIAAGGGGDGRIWFWRPSDASNFQTLVVPTNIRDMAVHPSGKYLAIAGFNGSATVYGLFS